MFYPFAESMLQLPFLLHLYKMLCYGLTIIEVITPLKVSTVARLKKKQVQNYSEILEALDPRQPYSIPEIVEFAATNGLLADNPSDDFEIKKAKSRVSRTLCNYTRKLDIGQRMEITGQWPAWLGYHWKARLLVRSGEESLELEEKGKALLLAHLKERSGREAVMNQRRHRIGKLAREIDHWVGKCGLTQAVRSSGTQAGAPPTARPRSLSCKGMVLAILTTVGLAISAAGVVMVQDPFELLRRYGLATAKQALPAVPQTAEEIYNQSWLAYLEGKHDLAAHGIYTLLAEDSVPNYLQGDSYYLLGLIDTQKGQYQQGVGHYLQAYETYLLDTASARLYIVGIEIANSYVALDSYEHAETWLVSAFDHYQNDRAAGKKVQDIWQYYLVKLEIAAARENYGEALIYAMAGLEETVNTKNRAMFPYAYSQVGFWYGVNGCPELAAYYTDLANGAYLGTGDDRPLVFNMINSLLLQRQWGYSIKPRSVTAIRSWAQEREDQKVENVLNLALSIPITTTGYDCEASFPAMK